MQDRTDRDEVPYDVNSKAEFLSFLAALRQDLIASQSAERSTPSTPYGAAVRGWQNRDLVRFLEAMHAWAADMGDRLPETPSWQGFANLLAAAKVYE